MLLVAERLRNQHLLESALRDPADVVARLGAVQAQDYTGAKWALGQRVNDTTDADVERAFNDGAILRTHVLRPTWHFVTPADIRWMLALSGPRVIVRSASAHRELELDHRAFSRSWKILERALGGGAHLTRVELRAALTRAGISAAGVRLGHLLMRAELEGLICSGPRQGKHATYAWLERRVPPATPLSRDESLARLARAYFSSHGPATERDYVWWSGLTVGDARAGMAMIRADLDRMTLDGLTCWSMPSPASRSRARLRSGHVHLLPIYDEYLIAYKDRVHVTGAAPSRAAGKRDDVFSHYLMVDGQLAGTWSRTLTTRSVVVDLHPYAALKGASVRMAASAVERYGRFLRLDLRCRIEGSP